eukprot:TRINITY_DN67868_c4_g1_i12.p2 TRINITY_DN67868_c4_g1~~TRINITY_DN67868_c4_g1_i12.p2  ORF type:complete len:164 (-),score=18.98 TRINITY_DN67868_c4_g1_i12:201-692(-)
MGTVEIPTSTLVSPVSQWNSTVVGQGPFGNVKGQLLGDVTTPGSPNDVYCARCKVTAGQSGTAVSVFPSDQFKNEPRIPTMLIQGKEGHPSVDMLVGLHRPLQQVLKCEQKEKINPQTDWRNCSLVKVPVHVEGDEIYVAAQVDTMNVVFTMVEFKNEEFPDI